MTGKRRPRPGVRLPLMALGMCVCPQEELQHRQISRCRLTGLPCLPVQGPGALRVPSRGLPATPHLPAVGPHPRGGVGQGLLRPGHQGTGRAGHGQDKSGSRAAGGCNRSVLPPPPSVSRKPHGRGFQTPEPVSCTWASLI